VSPVIAPALVTSVDAMTPVPVFAAAGETLNVPLPLRTA